MTPPITGIIFHLACAVSGNPVGIGPAQVRVFDRFMADDGDLIFRCGFQNLDEMARIKLLDMPFYARLNSISSPAMFHGRPSARRKCIAEPHATVENAKADRQIALGVFAFAASVVDADEQLVMLVDNSFEFTPWLLPVSWRRSVERGIAPDISIELRFIMALSAFNKPAMLIRQFRSPDLL